MEFSLDGKRVFAGTGGRTPEADLPWILLLHGAGMDHTVFALQARALAHHGRNVLALDLPGHGESAGPALDSIGALADWVLAAAAAVGAGLCRLAGHSMGALVALEAAALGGPRVEAAAFLGIVPEMRVHPDLLAAARAGAPDAVRLMTSWSFGAAGRLGGTVAPGLWLPGSALRLLERAHRPSLAADLAACDGYRAAADSAGKIRCPVLLVLGSEDRMTPSSQGKAFAGSFAAARVTVLEEVGHMMMLEAPQATLAALRTIL
jgi:pimeloyl-ACP methyl ester carboxylesterase